MTEYKPTNREVLEELLQGSKEQLKNSFQSKKKHLTDFSTALKVAGICATIPYTIPAYKRRIEPLINVGLLLDAENKKVCGGLGVLAGCLLVVAQISAYSYAIQRGHGEALAIPALTNLASYGYEKWRGARERVIAKSSIEDNLEEGND